MQHHETVIGAEPYRRSFTAGTVIFQEGEEGDNAFIIESGEVEITFQRQGRRVRMATLSAGDSFVEMALIDERDRSATATALTEINVVVVQRGQIQSVLRDADMTLRLLLEVLLGRFRSMQGRLDFQSDAADGDSMLRADAPQRSREEAHKAAIDRLKLEQELQAAIDEDGFQMNYQPMVSLRDGLVSGFEALIRWSHSERGFIPPNQFLSVAQRTDLIRAIDHWVTRTTIGSAAKMGKLLSQRGMKPPRISLNLSGPSFSDDTILNEIRSAIVLHDVDRRRITIEITEGVLIVSPRSVASMLDKMRQLGVQVALDDFGTGYSSLSYLVGFPIDTLKIDRVFVKNMMQKDNSFEVVKAIVGHAHSMELDVIAEGLEEVPQLQSLWQLNVEYGQGFLLSEALPFAEAADFASGGPVITRGPVLLRR